MTTPNNSHCAPNGQFAKRPDPQAGDWPHDEDEIPLGKLVGCGVGLLGLGLIAWQLWLIWGGN